MKDNPTSVLLEQNPIRRTKLYEMVAGKIETMIQAGELKPGDRLPSERDIMAAYNIGRPAVREALLALEGKGLITTENGRRATVRLPSVGNVLSTLEGIVLLMMSERDNLKNLFEARVFIEAAMVRHAANAISPDGLAELEYWLGLNRRAIGNREKFMQTDIEFHAVLFRTAANPLFNAIYAALVGWLMERWRQIRRTKATEALAYEGHQQIYDAVAAHDPDRSEVAMRTHLGASWQIWERQLNRAR